MKEEVLKIIKEHKGHENAITSAEIMSKLPYATSDSEVRATISDLVCFDRALIGSNDCGFFWIETKADLMIAKGYIASRIAPMQKRVIALDFNWQLASQTQPEFIL